MAGGLGLTQERRFSTQPIPISGRRILSAAKNAALPSPAKIVAGALPTGYVDHGSVSQGRVEVNVEINKDSIDLGRIPTPHRYYITGQRGTIRAQLQEYQPEMVDLQAGNTGVPLTAAGYSEVYIGGKLGSERRILVFDDFDVDFAADGFLWDQYWWTSPNAQAGGTFTLAEEKAATVIPVEYELLYFTQGNFSRLLHYLAIDHS